MVDGVHLVIHVGDKQILETVLIIVGGINTHAGAGPAILAIGYLGREPDFFELASTIDEEKIGNGVVGNEEIHPVIIINIGRNRSPGFPANFSDSGFLRHIAERAVAVVMKQVA